MITITGSNSFIGKNLINFLNQKKIKNSFLLRKKIKNSINKSNYYKFSKEQKKQTDILIHISSPSLALLYRKKKFTNQEVLFCIENELDNLLSLIDFYKKNNIKKFILISSSSLYGKSKFKKPFNEKDKCNPKDYYSIIKLAVETVAQKICKNIIIIRPFQIYGKFDNPHRLIPTLFNSTITVSSFIVCPIKIQFITNTLNSFFSSLIVTNTSNVVSTSLLSTLLTSKYCLSDAYSTNNLNA